MNRHSPGVGLRGGYDLSSYQTMPKKKIAIALDADMLRRVDRLVLWPPY